MNKEIEIPESLRVIEKQWGLDLIKLQTVYNFRTVKC